MKSACTAPSRYRNDALAICAASAAAGTSIARADPRGLEEIVVTARKRVENLQDVPVSINVVSKKMLDSLRITGLESLGRQIPGLHTAHTTGAGGGNIMRGIRFGGNRLADGAGGVGARR